MSELITTIQHREDVFFGTSLSAIPGNCGSGKNCSSSIVWLLAIAHMGVTAFTAHSGLSRGFVVYKLFGKIDYNLWNFTKQTLTLAYDVDTRERRRLIATWSGRFRGLGLSSEHISGVPAQRGEFPSVVSIQVTSVSQSVYCTGSIVGSRDNPWLLTAKHCLDAMPSADAQLKVTLCGIPNIK